MCVLRDKPSVQDRQLCVCILRDKPSVWDRQLYLCILRDEPSFKVVRWIGSCVWILREKHVILDRQLYISVLQCVRQAAGCADYLQQAQCVASLGVGQVAMWVYFFLKTSVVCGTGCSVCVFSVTSLVCATGSCEGVFSVTSLVCGTGSCVCAPAQLWPAAAAATKDQPGSVVSQIESTDVQIQPSGQLQCCDRGGRGRYNVQSSAVSMREDC